MNYLLYFFILIGSSVVFSGMIVFVSKRKHLLSVLFSLEYMVLGIFIIFMFLLVTYNSEIFFSLIFLTLAVCEGALGLSILVSLVRSHGNDYFTSFNVLQC
uniref:NADH-ubiquinone oxidoreductase chain 4L n=1 Tax=Pedetontus zhejiangensis TaxID=554671 RepID=A0A7L8EZI6_9INSE|nr:NADH dehydrogenase subunit 4L [Pedetontus zhejiangensis]QOE17742.1 NADH dehydrogenase subunit 4L [Pedetontus zhejiangensis]